MPLTPEEEWAHWDAKLIELRHGQLKTVQDAAAGWAKLFAAVLGIYGTVAFAGGLTSLDKLAAPFDTIARIATFLAAVAALLATWWATLASQDLEPEERAATDANSLRAATEVAVRSSLRDLRKAKKAGYAAAAIVLAGSTMILWQQEAESPAKPPKVLAIVAGEAVCGPLARADDGSLEVDETPLAGEVQNVTVVAACPAAQE